MKVGICLPMMHRELDRELLLAWVERAERSPLSSLGAGERVAWEGLDGWTALVVAAGATRRIRLLTCVLATPLYNATLLAKQAATVDVLSGGRLTLGLGISSRPQDFAAAQTEWAGRGERFEEQLRTMRRVWAGVPPVEGSPAVGPAPVREGGPELLVGAFAPRALRRAGRLADGILTWSFGVAPAFHQGCLETVREAWREAGRKGEPRQVAALYFALGPDAEKRRDEFLRHYYGYVDAREREPALAAVTTTTPYAVREAVRRYEDVGIDEVLFAPTIAGADQVDRLADAVGASDSAAR